MNFNSILIGSEDPQALTAYYAKLLGKATYEDSAYTSWQLGNGMVSIGPHDEVTGKNAQPGRLIWNIETTDVRGEFDRFVAAGAIVVREPYVPGGAAGSGESGEGGDGGGPGDAFLIATFADPDGNYFQLMSPMPAM
ncbi:MAG TPA: VOC family protein [Vicinamibacterales bacterium]|nr:VOC family protein [Vicinamibacterales bacterium]